MSRVKLHPVLAAAEKGSLRFFFEGRELFAHEGEVIASALFANNIKVFGHHHKDGSPQGIFCANGQCAQCMVIADGKPVKSCMTRVREGMHVSRLDGIPVVPLHADQAPDMNDLRELECDLLVVGGGPSGLGAAIEAADSGLSVILVDDKDVLGGKLVLQTHMFFGSVDQCHAGTRGIDIAAVLAAEVARRRNINVMLEAMVVGVYSDKKVGLVLGGRQYLLVNPRSLLIATGARERALVFPGCDLPGVYGAGAFQTLLNRDLIRPAENLFVVGAGNVGLISAYHALQAGINVVGLAEGLPEVGGYWVHADKLRRFGVPIYTSTTVVSANGTDAVESVTVAEVDEKWNVRENTFRTYACDTLLIAVGLEPVNELYASARRFGFDVYVAGDAQEIAEASAAMFSGRVTGREIARAHGRNVEVPGQWREMVDLLKSKPGREALRVHNDPRGRDVFPVIWCTESIPCNPCTVVCPQCAIEMPEHGSILSRSEFDGECRSCGKCVAACPALAITLVDLRPREDNLALVTLPYEFTVDFEVGDSIELAGQKGNALGPGRVVRITDKQSRAPCSGACPAGVHAQGYIEFIRKRKFDQAMELLRRDLPLPGVCGRVCYHPCEKECGRAEIDEPISILALKRFVTDQAMQKNRIVKPLPIIRAERVAVIGAGPSGLACANELLHRGFAVTVFEAAPKAGGILRYGIPAYRLPDAILDWDLNCLTRSGVRIRTSTRVQGLDELREQGFAAIYVSTGAPLAARMNIPGEDTEGVVGALDFLRLVNSGELADVSGEVVVIGGGNSALDAARAALRLGARQVMILYRRSREEMPAHDAEIIEAEEEGVIFEFLAAPVRIEGNGERLRMVCLRMKLGKPDASGRCRPMPIEGSEFDLHADMVVPAIGQSTDLGNLAATLQTGAWNNLVADPVTQLTNEPGVFAGGDVVTGPATVVEAFGAGKRAAESIDRYLSGQDPAVGRGEALPVSSAEAVNAVKPQARAVVRSKAPEERVRGFAEVTHTLSEEEAVREAERCLGCGVYSECMRAADDEYRFSHESTSLVTVAVDREVATLVAGIRVQDEAVTRPIATVLPEVDDDDVVVCRCERVTRGQIRRAIRAGVRDMNHLKAMLNTGLGACGGKTCGPLIRTIFRQEGVSLGEVTPFSERPLAAEVPLGLFAGVEDGNNSNGGEA